MLNNSRYVFSQKYRQTKQDDQLLVTSLSSVWRTFRLSFKIAWTNPDKIPNMLATSRTVIPLFSRTSLFTESTLSLVLLIIGCSLSILHLKQRSHQFWTCRITRRLVFCLLSVSKGYFLSISDVYWAVLPSWKQMLLQTCWSLKCASSWYFRIANGTTHFRALLNKRTCCSFCLLMAVEIFAGSSSVILQPVQTLFDLSIYIYIYMLFVV